MDTSKIKVLKQKKDELDKKQAALLEKFKTEHGDLYTWFVENEIDLNNLSKYSLNIAAAFVISMNVLDLYYKPTDKLDLTPQVQIIQVDELRGLNEDQKAKLVWERYGHIINRVAKKYDLDPKLIFATIMIESGGNTYAVRYEPRINDASYGLGQILFGTAIGLEFEGTPQQLFDPEVNIELIGRYHKRNMTVYGGKLTPQELTTAYNTGSPYNKALPGHLNKFNKWYEKAGGFVI